MPSLKPFLATLNGDTFGIGATEGTKGADAAALVMLALFVCLLTLIVVVGRGIARRGANPAPEHQLLDEISARSDPTLLPGSPSLEPGPPGQNAGDEPGESANPWEKPSDWWRKNL